MKTLDLDADDGRPRKRIEFEVSQAQRNAPLCNQREHDVTYPSFGLAAGSIAWQLVVTMSTISLATFVLVNGRLSKANLFSLIAWEIKKVLYLTPICHRALSCSLWLETTRVILCLYHHHQSCRG